MVIYEFLDAPHLINDLLDEGNSPHILQYQINIVYSTWSPKQCGVPLHKKYTTIHIISYVICYDLHHIMQNTLLDDPIHQLT